ncbi:MAG TPA: crotonase/enoyl-CoA hydratase family protein [Deltaproteobacteria bacterium]|jgi:enoyl-CoA hydratase/carnithine racemase|nr:crotonase/enoyl-CoA hydratase family protein [Deltaproteobacteria bacterium]
MNDRVLCSVKDGVAEVRLNRPDKLNALDLAMFEALVETGRSLMRESALRAVVLSGEGRAFCAGLDFSSFAQLAAGASAGPRPSRQLFDRNPEESPANFAQHAAFIWTELPVPVIAAIHGVAYGGGLQIALGADVRYVAPDARLSIMEVKWGLVPDMSGTQTLRHLVRLDVAKELAFTGRVVGGSEAVGLGLATHLSDTPLDAARALAREIAGKSPDAVRAAKRLLSGAFVSRTEEGLRLEESLQGALLGKPNQVEAVKANLERREPHFTDPQ